MKHQSTGSQSKPTNFTCSNNEIKGQNGEDFSLENLECEAKDQENRTFLITTLTSSTTTTSAARSTISRRTEPTIESSTTTKSGNINEEKITKEATKWSSSSTTKSQSNLEEPTAPRFFNKRGKRNNKKGH